MHGILGHSFYTIFWIPSIPMEHPFWNPAFPCLPGKEMLAFKYTQMHVMHSTSVIETLRMQKPSFYQRFPMFSFNYTNLSIKSYPEIPRGFTGWTGFFLVKTGRKPETLPDCFSPGNFQAPKTRNPSRLVFTWKFPGEKQAPFTAPSHLENTWKTPGNFRVFSW